MLSLRPRLTPRRLLLVAGLIYLLLMLASAPAWLLATLLPDVRVAAWQGTLWQGSALQLQRGEQRLDQLRWQWQFPLHWQLDGSGPQLRFSSRLSLGLSEQQLSAFSAHLLLAGQPVVDLSASLLRFNADRCLQADNLHWQLTGSARTLLAGRADTDGLLYCDDGQLKLDADTLRLSIGLQHYQPILRQHWIAPQYRALLR